MTRARAFAAAVSIALLAGTGAAAAQSDYVGRKPITVVRDPAAPAGRSGDPTTKVLGRTFTRSAPIPITGGDVAGLVALGASAVGTGTFLLRRGRRAPR